MNKLQFINTRDNISLSKAIIIKQPNFSVNNVLEFIKKKDVRVNDTRVTEDVMVKKFDSIVVFYRDKDIKNEWYTPIYDDANILVVFKKAGIEVVSEDDRSLVGVLSQRYNVKPVHRIDRNTEGLVIFAKNIFAEKALLNAFKERTITKKYILRVHGIVKENKLKNILYLAKDKDNAKVLISQRPKKGYDQIITNFKVLDIFGDDTLLEAELVTGKTHQIRAHIAYLGHPIVGDGKYGKQGDDKQMCLTSYYMSFNFPQQSFLHYMNGQVFQVQPTWKK